jgi:hypothetical protein
MTQKANKDAAKRGTELEQERRKTRLATELRANLKRRKAGHSTPKTSEKADGGDPSESA